MVNPTDGHLNRCNDNDVWSMKSMVLSSHKPVLSTLWHASVQTHGVDISWYLSEAGALTLWGSSPMWLMTAIPACLLAKVGFAGTIWAEHSWTTCLILCLFFFRWLDYVLDNIHIDTPTYRNEVLYNKNSLMCHDVPVFSILPSLGPIPSTVFKVPALVSAVTTGARWP